MLCPGSHILQQGLPDTSSEYAAEGTAAHQVLTWALREERPAASYIGRQIHLNAAGKPCADSLATYTFVVDDDMASHVQVCVDYCLDLKGDDGVMFVDIRVNYSEYLGVNTDEAWGTADVIIVRGDEIIVVDFKYGRGVEVSAERNPQMSLYALGALQAYQGLVADYQRVRMAISQPRAKKAPSEWDCSVEELETWGRSTARSAVNTCTNAAILDENDPVWQDTFLRPGEKQCKFCKAKATCPALRAEIDATVTLGTPADVGEFETIAKPTAATPEPTLAGALSKVDMIEDWCKAIRAEAERRLLAGEPVTGFKLVQGKKGNRAWSKAADAEKYLRETVRLPIEKAYDMKIISPTTAEKLAKAGDIGPRQWATLKDLITQPEGKPHVAPASDSRPALVVTPVIEDFTDVTPLA